MIRDKNSIFKYCSYCGSNITKTTMSGFHCKNCLREFYLYSKPTISVIPMYKNEILLTQRGTEPWKGMLSTIGGFLENGEDPLRGAVREFKEETGVTLTKDKLFLLGFVPSDYPYKGIRYNLLNILYVYPVAKKIYLNPKDDVMKLVWISIQEKDNLPHKPTEFINEVFKKIFANLEILKNPTLKLLKN